MQFHTFSFIFLCFFVLFNSSSAKLKGDVVDISIIIDNIMPDIKEIIIRSGHDPMEVPPVQDYASPVYINLTEGIMTGAVNLHRDSKFNVTFSGRITRFKCAFLFDELVGKFNYSIRSFGFYKDNGTMETIIRNVRVGVRIDYIMEDFVLRNPLIKILKYGDVEIKLQSSDSYINWAKNIMVNRVIHLYEEQITRIAQKTAYELAEKNIKFVNNLLKKSRESVSSIIDFLRNLANLQR